LQLLVEYQYFEECFESALEKMQNDQHEYGAIQITVTYNLARVLESMCMYDDAEKHYKQILAERPSYMDCECRL
jgi:RNA polymerase-associated protein CTR9